MRQIELERWEPSSEKPQELTYAGQRTAQEVFEELKLRLDGIGYLPDEYFLLDGYWKDGKEIPKGTDLFVTTDYGASEGIYLNVCLRWCSKQNGESITKTFVTGKTLGESSGDMDRMHLISSAIIKAFHTDGIYARYIKTCGSNLANDVVIHFNEEERRVFINSLVNARNTLLHEVSQVERLLRRVTGSITEFVCETGARPLSINDFDMTVLLIQDGNLEAFYDIYRKVPEKTGELLVFAAGRPGMVGENMTKCLLFSEEWISCEQYEQACKAAISIADMSRVLLLMEHAEICVREPDKKLCGNIISTALDENKGHIAKAVLDQCTPEQIQAIHPRVLVQAIRNRNVRMACSLIEGGIETNSHANQIIYELKDKADHYIVGLLTRSGMKIDSDNYEAMSACLRTKNEEAAKDILHNGMNFDEFIRWSEKNDSFTINGEFFDEIRLYWEERLKD